MKFIDRISCYSILTLLKLRLLIIALLTFVNVFFAFIFIIIITCYKIFISPLISKSCIFYPTCSEYAINTLRNRSFFIALFLIVKRLSKCHAFYNGDRY